MNYILFDTHRQDLLPFTHTRPSADIRCGVMTMRERWEHLLHRPTCTLTDPYLQNIFHPCGGDDNVYINGSVFGTGELTEAIQSLAIGQKLIQGDMLIAARTAASEPRLDLLDEHTASFQEIIFTPGVMALRHVWDIFSLNDMAIRLDFLLLTTGKTSAAVPHGVTVTGRDIFIEEGAVINPGCIINAQTGPVYIGKDAEILEGTMIRGPLALCTHAVIKMGAKIYGATTIGPGCKVGGEINNTVFFANSNKGHDGYLGNAVIGEWCNLGADTNCSNLKNNYDEVKIWSESKGRPVSTGLTFCGLLMGDHSKCGINTMFNTGTVVGVSCNVYGGGFPEKYIPSFSWGGPGDWQPYKLDKAMKTAARMMARRNKKLSDEELDMYAYLFNNTHHE